MYHGLQKNEVFRTIGWFTRVLVSGYVQATEYGAVVFVPPGKYLVFPCKHAFSRRLILLVILLDSCEFFRNPIHCGAQKL